MIPTQHIINAVSEILVGLWPQRMIYVDVCPQDFQRPSCWVQVRKNQLRRISPTGLERVMEVDVLLFDELDDHYDASWYRLAEDADKAAAALLRPLKTDGRQLFPDLQVLPRSIDRQVITLLLSFRDNIPEDLPSPDAPQAEELHMSVQVRAFPEHVKGET